ncbi:hypothetical protein OSTOST_18468, partial [Ostertagia ostertagi]
PDDSDIERDLEKAVSSLSARNELLVIADGDLSVFAFYDQHKKAEGTQDPILAAFLKKKEKESDKPHKENQLALPLAVAALNFFYRHLERGEAELQKFLIDLAKKQTPAIRHKEKATDEDGYSTDVKWLLIPKSKTDQIKRGTTVAFRVQDNRMVLWDKLMGPIADEPDRFLFSTDSAHPASSDSLRRRINEVLRSCGIQDKGLTSHSLRGGAATAAMRKGVKYEDIQSRRMEVLQLHDVLFGANADITSTNGNGAPADMQG